MPESSMTSTKVQFWNNRTSLLDNHVQDSLESRNMSATIWALLGATVNTLFMVDSTSATVPKLNLFGLFRGICWLILLWMVVLCLKYAKSIT